MYLPEFQYVAPKTMEELTAALAEHGEKAKILCGGTDLLVAMKDGELQPECVIDINGLDTLTGIQYEDGKGLVIGAATRFEEIEQAQIVKDKYHALYQSAGAVGSPQVRTMGSIGGNSCTASPAADTPPSLIAFGAKVNLVSAKGRREMPLEEFIRGNRMTALGENEFLESIALEEPWPNSASRYHHMGLREAMEIDMVNVAVNLALEKKSGKVNQIRIVMGAVAPTPLRALKAEELLKGKSPDETLIEKAAETCAEASKPIDDFRASAAYRREIVKVLSRRAINDVLSALK
jgi:carbon-monoxide dehydrogenase medium subunit